MYLYILSLNWKIQISSTKRVRYKNTRQQPQTAAGGIRYEYTKEFFARPHAEKQRVLEKQPRTEIHQIQIESPIAYDPYNNPVTLKSTIISIRLCKT